MDQSKLKQLLEKIKNDELSIEDALHKFKDLPYTDLGFAKIDHHREIRVGYPEVVYCAGKTVGQVKEIVKLMFEKGSNVLATRATPEMYHAVQLFCDKAIYSELGRTITIQQSIPEAPETPIGIITAGTSDIPVAEEAAVTAEIFGNKVERIFDVGVAGIHRLFDKLPDIRSARVLVVIAGMEGALASVVGGLVNIPIIAVPTSIGYGANFGGISALLGMLTSCASGISVVNIDNGFGAGYLASMINKLK